MGDLGAARPQGEAAACQSRAAMDLMQRCQYQPVDIEGGDHQELNGRDRVFRPAALLRRSLCAALLVGALFCLSEMAGSYVVKSMDVHREFQRSSLRDTVGLWDHADDSPFVNEWSCPQDGRVCICAHGFAPDGLNKNGEVKFVEREGWSGCQPWFFKVGDVLAFERPTGGDQEQLFTAAKLVSTVTGSPIVHTGIVTQVPPPGVNQTGENVIVTEALKGMWQEVVQNPLRYVIERWPFGGFQIRRIDPVRFPKFRDRAQQVAEWASAKVGQPFDKDMLVPFKRRWTTGRRYVTPDPDCEERKRAFKMYQEGGPGKWICSELVSWALAFAGGLNLDYPEKAPDDEKDEKDEKEDKEDKDDKDDKDRCIFPRWNIKNIQQNPGQLFRDDIYDPNITWKVPCGELGCYVAVPKTADWAGGTVATTTTTSTVASSNTMTWTMAPFNLTKDLATANGTNSSAATTESDIKLATSKLLQRL